MESGNCFRCIAGGIAGIPKEITAPIPAAWLPPNRGSTSDSGKRNRTLLLHHATTPHSTNKPPKTAAANTPPCFIQFGIPAAKIQTARQHLISPPP
jgi:hypothetical protein